MANPKRASMREGPLAALFRKTEGEDGEPAARDEPAPAVAAPEAATPAAAVTPHPRESGLPHPALRASSTNADEDARGDSVPTPRERLRHAFSSEIPENVMDRPAARPVMDDYSREHPACAPIGIGRARSASP